MPRPPNNSDWFSTEERYRREANAHAYRQHGTPQNWYRYLSLGFFAYDDCTKFDTLWMKYSSDPVICHRMVLYNFMYHVDRRMDIPPRLSAWATDVSQPYLQRYAPQYLAINTIDTTWNDHIRGDHDVMDIEATQWTQVGTKKQKTSTRSQSPTGPPGQNAINSKYSNKDSEARPGNNLDGGTANSFPLKKHNGDNSNSGHTQTPNTTCHDKTAPPDHPIGDRHPHLASSNKTTASESSYTDGKQSALYPDINIPTNDGTYRLTFRWSPNGDFTRYNEQSTFWLNEVHAMLCDLFPADDCFFYRWESVDLQLHTTVTALSPGELRDFLSPNITFLSATSQIIFGARVCFASKYPGQWRYKETTVQKLAEHHVQVKVSNSTTTSGKIVTAGYILFKAARTTHRDRFLQSLRQQLPPATPFFDILLFHRTPMEQKISHLVIQCGETHVAPLSQSLSALLTGRNSPLFLSRLALTQLQPSQISAYFEMQDAYAKSLKSFPLYPTLINLDRTRTEFFDDGTVIERSTRDWATTIFKDSAEVSARCEVVNGGLDQKAYLLVPKPFAATVEDHLRQYRLRINPIGRREARFRDSLPGLPSVIHIDNSTQQNLELLELMSSMEMWQKAPPAVRGLSDNKTEIEDQSASANDRRQEKPRANNNPSIGKRNAWGPTGSTNISGKASTRTTTVSEHDDNTALTQSATHSIGTPSIMSSATTRRLNELESLFRQQQQETAEHSTLTSQTASRLEHIESKLGRIDAIDAILNDNRDKLVVTMERQQDSHVQIIDLNIRVSKLMDVIDRMASRIETLTEALVTQGEETATEEIFMQSSTRPSRLRPDTNRRRTLDEMKDLVGTEADSPPDPESTPPETTSPSKNSPSQQRATTNISKQTVTSPSKKKTRSLQEDLEGMSLESDVPAGETINFVDTTHLPATQMDSSLQYVSLLDNSDDDFSTTTPDLDAQYNTKSDPEGGGIK